MGWRDECRSGNGGGDGDKILSVSAHHSDPDKLLLYVFDDVVLNVWDELR